MKWESSTDPTVEPSHRILHYRLTNLFSDFPAAWANIQNLNHKFFNIHPCVNPRFKKPGKRGKNSDVTHFVALWVDVDFHGEEAAVRKQWAAALAYLDGAGLHPSCIIESGNGIHAYWFLDKPYPNDEARPYCAGIQDACKISDAINDPSRVLRMPGTLNVKDHSNPKHCEIVEASFKRYPLNAFKDFRVEPGKSKEEVEDEKDQQEVKALNAKAGAHPSRDPLIEDLKKNGVSEGGRHDGAKRMAGHWAVFAKSKKALLQTMEEWNKLLVKPPIDDEQIVGLVNYCWDQEQIKRIKRREAGEPVTPRQQRSSDPHDGDVERSPYFEGKEFLPEILANELCERYHFLSTPIGNDGIGVKIHVYNNGVFRQGGEDLIVTESRKALGNDTKKKRVDNVVENINISKKIHFNKLNPEAKNLVNVKNGMLNWKTGELLPHDPKYVSVIQINADYLPDAKCEIVDKFFADVLPPDEVPLVEEFMGYLMIPDTSYAKCLVGVGEGGNGKSTFLKLITHFIGQDNISNFSLHQISEEQFASAGLFGKLANFYDELESKALENTGIFKQIVSGDAIKAEEKNKAPFSFRPFCRLVFATNQMPRANDRSQAYYDRFLFVRFPNRIRETAAAVTDYDVVLASAPGALSVLLNRALSGLRRLKTAGRFSHSVTSTEAIEEYRRDCNSAYDFIQECCTFTDPTAFMPKADLYNKYKTWCTDSGRKPMGYREIVKTAKSLQVREVRHGDARGFGGISWINGIPPFTSADELGGLWKGGGEKSSNRDF